MSESGLVVQQELPIANAPGSQTPPPAAPRKFVIPDDAVLEGKPKAPAAPAPAASEATPAQNTGEQATPAESEGDQPEKALTPEEQAERDRKREGRRVERKISQAYRKAAEAQARAELAERQLAEQRAQIAPRPSDAPGKPTLEQFGYDPEKYAAAVETWASEQTAKQLQAQVSEQRSKQFQHQLVSKWEEGIESFADDHEDFAEVVGTLAPRSPLEVSIMEAGPKVAYFLGKNVKEAQRIAALPVLSQIREIGKLEAKLAAEPTKPKTPSKAPAPVTPLTGAAPSKTDVPSESDDMRDWMRKRNKQVASRR